jgi:hypothetical protein
MSTDAVHHDSFLDKPNPFYISQQDLNIIDLHDEVKEHNNQVKCPKQKIWQRKSNEKPRSARIKELLSGTVDEKGKEKKPKKYQPHHAINAMDSIEKYLANKECQEEKEVLVDFIAKKREIFLLQMSFDIKREEIRKLNDKTKAKEDALRNSEEALEQDALKFDVFLKDNDKKAQDAIRLAEKETKRKMLKVQEVKKLHQQLQVIQSSSNKYNSGLEECLQFKSFLQELTPHDWLKDEHDKKRLRQRERRRKRIEARQQKWRQAQDEHIALQDELKRAECPPKKRRGQSRRDKLEESLVTKPVVRPQTPSIDDEVLTSSDEEVPMYFKVPTQLLETFSTLEEENLFLIQNTQEAEQSLDEMTERFQESRAVVQDKADTTLDNINKIKMRIKQKQKNLETMKVRMEDKPSGSVNKEQKLMNNLKKSVTQLYQACGFAFAGATPSTLYMLAEIETKMEKVLFLTNGMPEQEFKRGKKVKEKKRREENRLVLQAEQIRLQEERNKKAVERSLLPPKKIGKKVKRTILD